MAAQVLLTALARLQTHDRAVFTGAPSGTLTQFQRIGDTYEAGVSDVSVTDRPPMAHVAEYRERPDWAVTL